MKFAIFVPISSAKKVKYYPTLLFSNRYGMNGFKWSKYLSKPMCQKVFLTQLGCILLALSSLGFIP